MSRRALAAPACLLTAALALTACGSGGDDTPGPTPAATADGFPVTLDNCGFDVTVPSPPQRIVTIKSTMTELALALGVGDRVVGTAFADGPLAGQYADAGAGIPVLSDNVPGQEALLAVEPDLVLGGWESNFSADGAGDRAELAQRGVATYVAPSACKEADYQPDPLTFEMLFDEFEEAGALLGVPDTAAALVAQQRARLGATPPLDGTRTAVWYSSGEDTPYVGAGIGAPEMMLEAAGLTNVFAGVHDTWTSVGWESVVAADPDFIVLVDATWNTAEGKIAALEANPATAQLSAVRARRYITIPFPAAEAGVRSVETVASIVDQVHQLGF